MPPTPTQAGLLRRAGANQALHSDRGRILVSRDTTPLERPRRVNSNVRYHVVRGSCEAVQVSIGLKFAIPDLETER